MSDAGERGILEAILAAPEEDGPRLVFADWLEEHGDPDRAEYIRLQIRHSQTKQYSPVWQEMRERIEDLHKRHGRRWLVGFPAWATENVQFRRGFPADVQLHVDVFLASAEGLARLMPLEGARLRVQSVRDVERLARHPALGRLRKLDMTLSRELNAESMEILARSPYLSRLVCLDVSGENIGDDGAAHLARAALPALRELDLTSTGLGPEGLRALCSAPFGGQLTELRLGHNPLVSGALDFLTSTPALELLHLHVCRLVDADMEALARVPLTRLRDLRLELNCVTGEGLAALAQSADLAALERLSLHRNPLGRRPAKRWPPPRSDCAHSTSTTSGWVIRDCRDSSGPGGSITSTRLTCAITDSQWPVRESWRNLGTWNG
jgi:uncharacterized protein (TIGR02996 family)